MDAISDRTVETVVVMSSAQVGKTEILNNIVGYHMHHDPAPMLLVQPTLEMAEAWSKDRLAPMIRDTEVLQGLVKDPRSRDSGNTLLHKLFPGGHITMAGSNAPASLASRPIRVVLCDEVDRYPASAGTEGDPVNLAKKRTTTFWNRKIILTSTPTVKGKSRIESAYEQSDQRRYFVPCPHCEQKQALKWGRVQWPEGEPEKALYHCEHCGAAIEDGEKQWMLLNGEWRATAPFKGSVGFHLSELYSPWVSFGRMACGFIEAKGNPETLKTWVNTSLGETWETSGEKVEADDLIRRKENWGSAAPEDVLLITAGIDVQADRLEVELVGWGVGEESWSLHYEVIAGDPAKPEPWKELDDLLMAGWPNTFGETLPVASAAIDSGGHHTQEVYGFCISRLQRRVYPIKGVAGTGRPIVGKPSMANRFKVPLYSIGVDTAKERLMHRLRITEPGAGYCHFPAHYEMEHFKQLTAEVQVVRFHRGFPTQVWEKRQPRNEALDCRVYAMAALGMLNVRLERMAADRRREEPKKPADLPRSASEQGKNDGWITKNTDGWIRR